MGRNPVTLQTIADRLGVSRTTVSNAYNRPDQLAPELRERILATAAELGYSGPDAAARRLRSGERDAIGLMFQESLSYAFTDPAAVLFLQGMAQATERQGLGLLLLPVLRGVGGGVELVRDAVVDAFVLYSMPDKLAEVAAARARRLPVVVVDEPRGEGTAFVGIDDRAGMRLAAEHLLGLGHRRIAVAADRMVPDDHSGPVDAERRQRAIFQVARDRLDGIHDALAPAGLGWDDVPLHEHKLNTREGGVESARALLAADPRPTAILALTDQVALGVLELAQRAGDRRAGRAVGDAASTTRRRPRAPASPRSASRCGRRAPLAGRLIVEGRAAGGPRGDPADRARGARLDRAAAA